MQVITGRIEAGKIELDTDLQDGTRVVVLVAGESGFQLTPEEEDELFASVAEIRSGLYEDGDELLAELRSKHRR